MSSVVAVTFEDPEQAGQMREALRDLEKQGLLSLDDAAVIVRDENGKFHVKGQADRGVKTGAVAGGAIGLLLASIFFPIGGIVLGALAGAGIGKAAKIGIDKKFVKDIEKPRCPITARGSSSMPGRPTRPPCAPHWSRSMARSSCRAWTPTPTNNCTARSTASASSRLARPGVTSNKPRVVAVKKEPRASRWMDQRGALSFKSHRLRYAPGALSLFASP